MFTNEDIAILKQPGSWEKLQSIQETFFPKLLALQIEANKLIWKIYGIDTNIGYNINQSPTSPSRKGQQYNSSRRLDDAHAIVGLRAKGKPSNLTQPNGKKCEFHFAILAFMMLYINDEPTLSVYFAPYLLQYAKEYRMALADATRIHRVLDVAFEVGKAFNTSIWVSQEISSLFELLQQRNAFFAFYTPYNYTDYQDLAKSVLLYASCFPMLDLFTRLSNGEEVFLIENECTRFPINKPDYATLFREWYKNNAEAYINDFYIEPVTEQEIWQSEALTRSIFEEILGMKFPKVRPSWLKSSENKGALELDGYCEELRLAFEYQGEYHYMEVPVHHQQRTLKEVQKNDAIKLKLCQKKGVDMIQVPYWEKGNRQWIFQALLHLHRQDIINILTMSSKN